MESSPDFQTGFNLLICYYALGDTEKMKKGFTKLASIPDEGVVGEDEIDESKVRYKSLHIDWIH
jgi:intraflagellar transport protein 88